jgi:hypothetical protein
MDIDFTKYDDSNNLEINSDSIKIELSKILKKVHTQSQKQEIGSRDGGLKIACPFCLDSKTNPNLKRGNIYLETSTYKCYNCNVWMPLDEFFSKFDTSSNFIIKKFDVDFFINRTNTKVSLYDLYNINNQYVDRKDLMKKMYLSEIIDNYKAAKYLESRIQNVYDKRMAVHPRSGDIVFFNMRDNSVIGIQKRIANPEIGWSRFMSYDYGDMMKKIIKSNYNEDDALRIRRLSLIYNILNIDLSSELNIFESTIDSHHFKNSIACWGVNSLLKVTNANYGLDSDNAGKKITFDLLNEKHNVFMWSLFKKENPIYKDCKDFNDVFKIKAIKQELFKKYITNSKLDIIHI